MSEIDDLRARLAAAEAERDGAIRVLRTEENVVKRLGARLAAAERVVEAALGAVRPHPAKDRHPTEMDEDARALCELAHALATYDAADLPRGYTITARSDTTPRGWIDRKATDLAQRLRDKQAVHEIEARILARLAREHELEEDILRLTTRLAAAERDIQFAAGWLRRLGPQKDGTFVAEALALLAAHDAADARCGFPSSVSDATCVLPAGHPADSQFRFHRYDAADLNFSERKEGERG